MAGIDFGKFTSAQLADLIRQADAKATSTFAVLGITSAALLARLTAVKTSGALTMTWLGFFSIAVLLVLLALKSVIAVIFPRLSRGSKSGLLYFGDIVTHTPKEYVRKIRALSDEDVSEQIFTQAYQLAVVANAKYTALRYALAFTGLAIIAAVLILLLA